MAVLQGNPKATSISRLAKAAGVQRYVVSVLIEANNIPHIKSHNYTVILPEGLPRLITILSRYPGVDRDFADRL